MQAHATTTCDVGWHARLRVRLGLRAGRTRILEAEHRGPLRVQRPFHPEGDGTAHLVVLHPPGGLVGGDRLHVDLEVGEGAKALVTTTGAGKAYRSEAAEVSVQSTLTVARDATLEHVPYDTVVFDGARGALRTRVRLAPSARFLGWEVLCLGRPACGERFTRGRLRMGFEVEEADGALLFVERGTIEGGSALLDERCGLAGWPAFGTMVCTHADVPATRDAVAGHRDRAIAAVTQLGPLTVVRALGRDGLAVRSVFERARHRVRDAWGRPRVDPAIWRS